MKMLTTAAVLSLAAGAAWGQDGETVVKQVMDHYKSVKGASVKLTLDIEIGEDNPMAAMMGDMDQTSMGAVMQPNVFAFWPQDPNAQPNMMQGPSPWVHSDGQTLISALPGMDIYDKSDAPESISAMLAEPKPANAMVPQHAWEMIPGADVVLELMSRETKPASEEDEAADAPGNESVTELLAEAEYKGKRTEDDGSFHVFLATQEEPMGEMQVEIHVAAEGKPWVIGVKPIMTEQQQAMYGDMSMMLRFTNWSPIDRIPEAAAVKIADDWEQVDNVMQTYVEKMMEMSQQPEAQPEQTEAPGQGDPAPNFSLTTLSGDSFTLADHKGKVVMLDFWATWCGPCIAGMPTVTKVTSDYADKGVVFAAINLREPADKVSTFMKEKDWNFRVPLDTDASVAEKYGVTGIPHSVLIDKTGTIRYVHVGFGGAAEYERRLRKEFDELVGE